MKEKGFTLIELLAVIVILAIIAMIAVPIILNIIEDTKNSSNKISVESYGKAIELAISNYELDQTGTRELTFDVIRQYIEYKGNKVECDTTQINEDGTVYLAECKVEGKKVEYTYGKEQIKMCKLIEGEPKEIGSKYACTLDEERIFYVLENNGKSNEITLLMDRNYTDTEVPKTMTWCDQKGPYPIDNRCNYDGLNSYIEKIQTKFGYKVTVGIPSKEQMENSGCTNRRGSCPQWTYNYLNGTENSSEEVKGYWTSTGDFISGSISVMAWIVYFESRLETFEVGNIDYMDFGIRPIIIVSKSDL